MAYYFKLPLITDLTIPQQAVLNEIGAFAVFGGPGTGKSVVALWRHIQNYDLERRKSLLLTYTKSLETYLSSSAKSENSDSGEAVNRTYWWTYHELSDEYDEIIIDEAQDIVLAKYELIANYTEMVSYSLDENQSLHLTPEQLRELVIGLPKLYPNNKNFPPLDENFRNTKEITLFTRSIFPNRLIPDGNVLGPKPILICTNNKDDIQNKIIFDIIDQFQSDTHNIAILLPLANAALHRTKTVLDYYNLLKEKGITCSYYENDNSDFVEIENIHITTFKSAKGLEFDTVIIPDFQYFKRDINYLHVVTENDYYVVFTRAKNNLILIDNSETNIDNKCNLRFLYSQIENNIINVDYDYIKSTNIDQTDDLSF